MNPKFIVNRRISYFNRRVPKDVRGSYNKSRISFSLKTKSLKQAHRSSLLVSQNLESHWISLRLKGNQFGIERYVKGFCKVPDSEDVNKDDITFSDALDIYLKLKGNEKPVTFKSSTERASRYLIAPLYLEYKLNQSLLKKIQSNMFAKYKQK